MAIELGDSDGSFHSHNSFNASDMSEEVKVEEIMPSAADLPKEELEVEFGSGVVKRERAKSVYETKTDMAHWADKFIKHANEISADMSKYEQLENKNLT